MSKAANHDHEWAHGASLLPQDLSDAELAAAPVLVSVSNDQNLWMALGLVT